MKADNRPRHYRKGKTEIVIAYYVRMDTNEKQRIRQIAKNLRMTPSKLLRLAIADTIRECLLY